MRPKFSVQVTGTKIWCQKLGSNSTCYILSKFLLPDKSSTRMHDRLAKLLVRDSGTSNLDGELVSCVMGLTSCVIHLETDHPHTAAVATRQVRSRPGRQ